METSQRRRLPTTTYVTASPETWSLIRGAYLSGLSAPTVAARFGISVTALRKRARREGWTKAAFAASATPWAVGRGPAARAGAGAAEDPAARADEAAVVALWRAPLAIRAPDLARKALAGAAQALKAGQGLNAVRLARAASEIARLDGLLDWADEDVAVADEERDGRDAQMRMFIREQALDLAERLVDGRDLPAVYVDLKAELARLAEVRRAATEAGT